jgi:hypothetical protein
MEQSPDEALLQTILALAAAQQQQQQQTQTARGTAGVTPVLNLADDSGKRLLFYMIFGTIP